MADKATKTPFDPIGQAGAYLVTRAQAHGLILRNLGDSVAFSPPLIITEPQVDDLLERFGQALDETEEWLAQDSGAPGR